MDEDSAEADESKPNRLVGDGLAPPRFLFSFCRLWMPYIWIGFIFWVTFYELSPFLLLAVVAALLGVYAWSERSTRVHRFQFSLYQLGTVVTLLAILLALSQFLELWAAVLVTVFGSVVFGQFKDLKKDYYRPDKRIWVSSVIGLLITSYLMLVFLTAPGFQKDYWERYCQSTVSKSASLVPGSDLKVRVTPIVDEWILVPFVGNIIPWFTTGPRFEVEIRGRAPSEEAVSLLETDVLERWRRYRGFQIEWKVDMAEDQVGLE